MQRLRPVSVWSGHRASTRWSLLLSALTSERERGWMDGKEGEFKSARSSQLTASELCEGLSRKP